MPDLRNSKSKKNAGKAPVKSAARPPAGNGAGAIPDDDLLLLHRNMLVTRRLDEKMMILLKQGKSFFHIGASGHEATQVAAAYAMRGGVDWSYPYYRDLAYCVQLGMTPLEVMLCFLSKAGDPNSGGRQMPAHYGHKGLRIVSQSSPTGTQYLQAVGTAESVPHLIAVLPHRDPRTSTVLDTAMACMQALQRITGQSLGPYADDAYTPHSSCQAKPFINRTVSALEIRRKP